MDKNKMDSIMALTVSLHKEIDHIYECLMDSDLKESAISVRTLRKSLEYLLRSLKIDKD